MSLLSKIFTWWDGPTFGTWLHTRRFGHEVGRDEAGNAYYRSKDGSRRWVVYAGAAEATHIPPEWYLWMHQTVDTLPSDAPVARKAWEADHLPNLTGTLAAYAPSGSLAMSGVRARATGDYEAWSPE